MKKPQFESQDKKDNPDPRPWRKDAIPPDRKPSNPDYPAKPFNYDEWMKSSKSIEEDFKEMPKIGDTIRTKKMQMEGKVERLGTNSAGYEEVFFRIADGRLMKTPLSNVTVVEKLADEDQEVMEDQLDEVSNELLSKYKTAAGKNASDADKKGDFATGDKRFKGIVKATKKQFANDAKKTETKEGSMGGINRSAPATDVSYEEILDEVYKKWEEEKRLDELSVDTLMSYKKSASSPNAMRTRPLRKMARSVHGVQTAQSKIDSKTGKGKAIAPDRGTNEDCWDGYEQIGMKDKGGRKVPNCVPKTNEVYQGPWHGDPDKLAKAPKTTMRGKDNITLSNLVQDTINVHGVKDAFEYYVKKHGMPPRHFQIYAGLVADPKKKEVTPPEPSRTPSSKIITKSSEKEKSGKESWWKKLRDKLPFEE